MSKYTQKEICTVHGTIVSMKTDHGERHTFMPSSLRYLHDCLNRIPIGKKVACLFSEHVPTRSEGQLAYHFVLVGYLCGYTGFTKDEMHDIILRAKFGVKELEFEGKVYEVRRSISERAHMAKSDAVELVNFDLELCAKFDIKVPTKSELGYIEG